MSTIVNAEKKRQSEALATQEGKRKRKRKDNKEKIESSETPKAKKVGRRRNSEKEDSFHSAVFGYLRRRLNMMEDALVIEQQLKDKNIDPDKLLAERKQSRNREVKLFDRLHSMHLFLSLSLSLSLCSSGCVTCD